MNFRVMLERDMRIQRRLLHNYEKVLSKSPKGGLSFKMIAGKPRYYYVDEENGAQKSLSRKHEKLIMQLKLKKQMEKSIKRMRMNLKWQEKLLNHYLPYDAQSMEQTLSPAYRNAGLQQYERKVFKTPEQWSKEDYHRNKAYPENLKHLTTFGLVVRSKSEALIAELLHSMGIPFRYDAELVLKDKFGRKYTYYPDFIIMTPQGKLIYWEHCGMFFDETYRNRFYKKLENYYHHDIILSQNLIVTMDGKDGNVDLEGIQQIIEGIIMPYFKGKS